jgi:hypothetical protein
MLFVNLWPYTPACYNMSLTMLNPGLQRTKIEFALELELINKNLVVSNANPYLFMFTLNMFA